MNFGRFLIPFFCALSFFARAEDWKTTDGKTYQGVTVVKIEDDAVTILYSDGGARIPLAILPADLQKKFHYDPAKAQAAAAKYDAQTKADKLALEKEAQLADDQHTAALQASDTVQPDTRPKFDPVAVRKQIDLLQAEIDEKEKILQHDYLKDAQNGDTGGHTSYEETIKKDRKQIWELQAELQKNGFYSY